MTFNSAVFFVFLAVFLPPYYLLPSWRAKKIWLLLGGLVFYGWFNPRYLGLVFLSTTIDYFCVRIITTKEDERTRKRHALLLATGQLRRIRSPAIGQVDEIECRIDSRLTLSTPQAMHLQWIGDIVGRRQVRKQRIILKHDSDAPPVRRDIGHRGPRHQHAAFRRRVEPGKEHQKSRLARAA